MTRMSKRRQQRLMWVAWIVLVVILLIAALSMSSEIKGEYLHTGPEPEHVELIQTWTIDKR